MDLTLINWTSGLLVAGAAGIAVLSLLCIRRVGRRRTTRFGESTQASSGGSVRSAGTAFQEGLSKTRQGLLGRLQRLWGSDRDTEAWLGGLEETLLAADVGLQATRSLLAKVSARSRDVTDFEGLRRVLRDEMRAALAGPSSATEPVAKPHVILVVGVNGVGKTTTIGKLAHRYRSEGKTVLLVAADTFRAAAGEQLQRWAERVGAHCVHQRSGADPSAVAYDGVTAGMARAVDVIIIDTAGRLHVKKHLVEELRKVARVIGRQCPGAPHEVLLVIDATTGQNAINQARVFQEALAVSGVVLTKLDGTARGGAAFAVRAEIGVPIRYVGLGEKAQDLVPFDADAFVDALLVPDGERTAIGAA
jgi:fused signal recognition particle receptor